MIDEPFSENKFRGQRQIKSFEAKDLLSRTIDLQAAIPIGIAVIDTGADYNHLALKSIIWTAREEFTIKISGISLDFPEGTFGFDAFNIKDKNKRGFPQDAHNHGTMVAGVIGADKTGVARFGGNFFPIQLLIVKAFSSQNSLDSMAGEDTVNIINSLDFILEARRTLKSSSNPIDLRIVNMSFGYYRRKNPNFSNILADKIKQLAKEGILFVASAGNNGRNTDFLTRGEDFTYYPAGADCDDIIAVAAANRNGGLWENSNSGRNSVHIAAPGDGIFTTKINNQFTFSSGTSMAAPFVSAAAALLLLAEPKLKNTDIKKRLLENADNDPLLNVASGGRLNIYQAVLKTI